MVNPILQGMLHFGDESYLEVIYHHKNVTDNWLVIFLARNEILMKETSARSTEFLQVIGLLP